MYRGKHPGVGFASLTEVLDLATPAGRAMAGLLAVFADFERGDPTRVCAVWPGLCARKWEALGSTRNGGAPRQPGAEVYRADVSKAEIARRLRIGWTSVRRILRSEP